MKIIVTGAAGLIGSWICKKLDEQGHTVVGIDSMIGGYIDSVSGLSDRFTLIYLDMSSKYFSTEIFPDLYEADVIYHCACLAPEGYSVFSPSVISKSVFDATMGAAVFALKHKIKKFINCSSMSRYGNSPTPFTEKTPISPADPYALAKVQAEQQLNLLSKLHGLQVIHTVPHNVIGPNQRYNDPFRNVVSIMTNLMLQERQPIIYGDGSQTRCFSNIQDDVSIYLKLLDWEGPSGEIFNIGPDDREISILNLAELIAKELNFDLNPQFEESRPHEVQRAICSSDKIREVFGYNPSMSLEDGIRSVVQYIKDRGPMEFNYHIPLELDDMPNTPKTWKERKF